ncbi:MAG TPA: class I SAM-dependent methyltransferase [Gaiellaceae bacterium]|nr:class I SAM-dependent methyltransferase [Gaiellaceae bacterium]
MDPHERSAIAHAGLPFQNPLAEAKVDALVARLPLRPGDRVVDLGCGKAELLLRILERHDVSAVGIDVSPFFLAEAREHAARRLAPGRLELRHEDASRADLAGRPFDLAIAVGAGGIWDGYQTALCSLAGLVRPGGHVLFGEGYWRREPASEYLRALGAERDELPDHDGLVAAAAAAGLALAVALESSEADWERYERRWAANGERWAAENPGHPGRAELLAWIENGRDRFERLGGRETLGFGLFLFRRA